MALTTTLIDVLKRELKARGLTYADVAAHIGLSEASVKRMFSTRDFMLSRLDEICEFSGIELSDLARGVAQRETLLQQLSLTQEKELVSDLDRENSKKQTECQAPADKPNRTLC